MGDTAVKTEKTRKTSWFKELKAEFKKIIWPDKESLAKKSVAVLGIAIVLGAFIASLDFVLQYLMKLIIG